MRLLSYLELEIAVPRKPLKLFTSGGSGEAIEISGIRDRSTLEAIIKCCRSRECLVFVEGTTGPTVWQGVEETRRG